jgi:hypothetical protein
MTRDLVIASLELQQWTSIDPETVRCSEVQTTATLYYTLPNYSTGSMDRLSPIARIGCLAAPSSPQNGRQYLRCRGVELKSSSRFPAS